MPKRGNSTIHFDPAESDEASVDPAILPERTEDIVRETIHPERLSPAAVARLTRLIEQGDANADLTPAVRIRIRTIINHLRPTPAELVNRWAFSFASEDPAVQGMTQNLVAGMLGLDKSTISRAVKKWRDLLNYQPIGARSQANHLGHRTRRAKAA